MNSPLAITTLILCWISAVLSAFWYFEWRWLQNYSDQLTWFNGEQLKLGTASGTNKKATVWHFYDNSCPCNRYTQEHIKEIENQYSKLGVSFIRVIPGSQQDRLLQKQSGNVQALPASPAIGIWNQQGELAYFGPYSSGVLCNSSTSFVEPVLQQVLQGSNPDIRQSNGIGCFCPWPEINNQVSYEQANPEPGSSLPQV